MLLLIITVGLCVPITTHAWDRTITVIIDNVIKTIEVDVSPITMSDELLAPSRLISEPLEISVDWDPKTRTINYNNYLFMRLNDNTAELANGTTMQMPVPPQIVDDRTLVPFKFIAKQFGFDCSFNENSNLISLKSNNAPMIKNVDYLIKSIIIFNNNAQEVQIPEAGNFNIGLNISKLTDAST